MISQITTYSTLKQETPILSGHNCVHNVCTTMKEKQITSVRKQIIF